MDYITPAIRDDFAAVNALVIDRLHSDVPLVESIGHYIVEGGGKRMRPLITLLCARALGYAGKQHVELAAVIEFLHTATLLHDDVVDVSALRRGRATANANWGNAPSVLVGDFIYSRAFQVLVGIGDMQILRLMSDTTNLIAKAKWNNWRAPATRRQRSAIHADHPQENRGAVRRGSRGAAMLAGAGADTQAAMRDYGMNLGLAFQLIDDVLDYTGDPLTMGKNLGDDLAEGKPTLPLIHTIGHGAPQAAALVRSAILARNKDSLAQIVTAVQDCGALDYARSRAEHCRELAVTALDRVPASAFRDNLASIAHLAVARVA